MDMYIFEIGLWHTFMFAATVFDPEWQPDNHDATAKSLWDKMVFQLPLFAVYSKYDVRMLLYSG